MGELATDLCAVIGKTMGDVLLRDPLNADEDFFRCGGDSLRAIEVLERLSAEEGQAERLGTVEIRARLLEAIFEDASPAGLASVIAAHA